MNNKENDRIEKLTIEVSNSREKLENITVKEIPEIKADISFIKGKIAVLSPLNVSVAVGVFLLIIGVALSIFFGIPLIPIIGG